MGATITAFIFPRFSAAIMAQTVMPNARPLGLSRPFSARRLENRNSGVAVRRCAANSCLRFVLVGVRQQVDVVRDGRQRWPLCNEVG